MFSTNFSSWMSFIFNKGWQFFNIQWPGTTITIGNIFIGAIVAVFVMKFLFGFLNISIASMDKSADKIIKRREIEKNDRANK